MNIVEPIRNKLDISKIENYLACKNTRNRLIFVLGVNTGLRISDILGLNIIDVINKNYIYIKEKKTNKTKIIPINFKLKILINEYIANLNYSKTNAPLFTGEKGNRLNRTIVYRFINSAIKYLKIDIAAVGTHTMRKTFGYHHYKMFNNIALLQKIFNHSSPLITLRYIGITQDEIDNSYKKFVL